MPNKNRCGYEPEENAVVGGGKIAQSASSIVKPDVRSFLFRMDFCTTTEVRAPGTGGTLSPSFTVLIHHSTACTVSGYNKNRAAVNNRG